MHVGDLQLSTHSALQLTLLYGDILSFKGMTESFLHQIVGSPLQVWENILALSNFLEVRPNGCWQYITKETMQNFLCQIPFKLLWAYF